MTLSEGCTDWKSLNSDAVLEHRSSKLDPTTKPSVWQTELEPKTKMRVSE